MKTGSAVYFWIGVTKAGLELEGVCDSPEEVNEARRNEEWQMWFQGHDEALVPCTRRRRKKSGGKYVRGRRSRDLWVSGCLDGRETP